MYDQIFGTGTPRVAFLALALCWVLPQDLHGQSMQLGINPSGISDWTSELPFVDLMHSSRNWYTKDVGNPAHPWNSEHAGEIKLRSDGYPLEIPQTVAGARFPQQIATIWGSTSGWPLGQYTVLWDGIGRISVMGIESDSTEISPQGRLTFGLSAPKPSTVELIIEQSLKANPVRNLRVLLPGSEANYRTQIFNPAWIARIKSFAAIRFMDWGATNGWGQSEAWNWEGADLISWDQRAKSEWYTWATPKGIPYEVMIRLLNELDMDGWICIPHRADAGYCRSLGELFSKTLESGRHLTVEYSNEIWNWMFGQTQWLNKYGNQSQPWPERTVVFVQRALDNFTAGFGGPSPRLTRVVAVQTAWLDVAQRLARGMRSGSFNAIGAAWYFGLSETADGELDRLGARASARDIDRLVRSQWDQNEKSWIRAIKVELADPMHLPVIFYEGGQHLTPTPFGEEPSYASALMAIQRDPLILGLYRDWSQFLIELFGPRSNLVLYHYSLVGSLSARYGSWGLLETLDQDTTRDPAPKWQAVQELATRGTR